MPCVAVADKAIVLSFIISENKVESVEWPITFYYVLLSLSVAIT